MKGLDHQIPEVTRREEEEKKKEEQRRSRGRRISLTI